MSFDPIKWIKGMHIGRGIANFFHNFKEGAGKTAVTITEAIKTATEGSLVTTLADTIDQIFHTHLAVDVITLLNKVAIQALAAELSLEGLPDNPTEADILAFETAVIKAISGLDPKGQSKLWTTFAAQVYGHLQEALKDDDTLTFAEIVSIVENSYQDYLRDKADAETDDPN